MNKFLSLIMLFSAMSYADICDDLYIKNKTRWENNDNMQLCKEALAGDADAQFDLAGWYKTEEHDPQAALHWVLKSAEQGCAKSQFVAGLMYYDGDGIEKDWFKAADLIEKSAVSGIPQAQMMLGYLRFYGYGMAADKADGLKWLETAAENRDSEALRMLGNLYRQGDGVPVDKDKAALYFVQEKMAEVITIAGGTDNKYPCDRYKN